jgi:hypothetical protein
VRSGGPLRPEEKLLHPAITTDPEVAGTVISSRRWRKNFELHSGRHASAGLTSRPLLTPRTEAALRRSLAVFQLGETGEGEHLLALTARSGDHDYLIAMRLFVAEEGEHACLLAGVLHQLDEPLMEGHWSDGAFQAIRRISGLRAEVLTLLVAEMVALRYYSALAEGFADHPDLAAIFERIHADEVRHLDFHADTLPAHLDQWGRATWWVGRIIWNVVLYASAAVVAWDHRRILRTCGLSARRFFGDCHRNIRTHEPRFFRRR